MSKEFTNGVVYAAARVVEMFDQPTIALAILAETGMSYEDMKERQEYDLAFLRKHDPSIPVGKGA